MNVFIIFIGIAAHVLASFGYVEFNQAVDAVLHSDIIEHFS